MRLAELTSTDRVPAYEGDVDIAGIATDSRMVQPGYLFAALPGSKADGAHYIEDALSRGAAALLVSPKVMSGCSLLSDNSPVAVIVDSNPRRRLARIAARFYGPQPDVAIAVTGTNGKTSIVDFGLQKTCQATTTYFQKEISNHMGRTMLAAFSDQIQKAWVSFSMELLLQSKFE